MSLQSKLQQHLATKNASWRADAATWVEAGDERVLYWTDGPLTASHVVDAHLRTLHDHAKPTLAYSGTTTEVARAAAARFGIALFNAAALPEPTPTTMDEGIVVPIADAPHHAAPIDMPPALAAQMVEALLPAHEPEPMLIAHDVGFEPARTTAPAAAPARVPALAPTAARAETTPHAPDIDPRFPWPVAPAREPSFTLRVPAEEFALMPWNLPRVLLQAAPIPGEDHHDLVVTDRKPSGITRPTQVPNWGLPWPRPVNPADGLAIADPKLWGAQSRLLAVREEFDRAGGSSFGAVKPEGSNWLKRLQSGL
ncbi:MAG: hypothetical protein WDA16_05405 [Candidatus Thermoplasmatota archaeon]